MLHTDDGGLGGKDENSLTPRRYIAQGTQILKASRIEFNLFVKLTVTDSSHGATNGIININHWKRN